MRRKGEGGDSEEGGGDGDELAKEVEYMKVVLGRKVEAGAEEEEIDRLITKIHQMEDFIELASRWDRQSPGTGRAQEERERR